MIEKFITFAFVLGLVYLSSTAITEGFHILKSAPINIALSILIVIFFNLGAVQIMKNDKVPNIGKNGLIYKIASHRVLWVISLLFLWTIQLTMGAFLIEGNAKAGIVTLIPTFLSAALLIALDKNEIEQNS